MTRRLSRELKALQKKGFKVKLHEEILHYNPRAENIWKRLPGMFRANGYCVTFRKETMLGYMVEVRTDKDRHVACVKLNRFTSQEVRDIKNGNRIRLNLSFLSPHTLEVTVIEKASF